MANFIQSTPYQYHFPYNDRGIQECCQKLKEILEKTNEYAIIKIEIFFEPVEKSDYNYSATFERDLVNKVNFQGLNQEQTQAIMNVFKQLNINITESQNSAPAMKASGGGSIIMGDSNADIGVKGLDLNMLRGLFPGRSDDELRKMFLKQ